MIASPVYMGLRENRYIPVAIDLDAGRCGTIVVAVSGHVLGDRVTAT